MSKYGISTDVFTTYLDDFHGRTVDFFRQSGELNVPTATCYDCHGIHDIRKPDDPLSTVYPTNLQKTCSKCHQDAEHPVPASLAEPSRSQYGSNPRFVSRQPGLYDLCPNGDRWICHLHCAGCPAAPGRLVEETTQSKSRFAVPTETFSTSMDWNSKPVCFSKSAAPLPPTDFFDGRLAPSEKMFVLSRPRFSRCPVRRD